MCRGGDEQGKRGGSMESKRGEGKVKGEGRRVGCEGEGGGEERGEGGGEEGYHQRVRREGAK